MSHVRKPLATAAILNTAIFIGEGIAGYHSHSLSLVMDCIHNLSDELALIALYLAYILTIKLSRNLQRIANAFNSVGLLFISMILVMESIKRIINPSEVTGLYPIVFGLLSAFANWGVAYFLGKVKNQNAAIKLAYVHNLGDIYVSLAPVFAGLFVLITKNTIFDPIIALGISFWIVWGIYQEIKSSGNQLIWPEDAVCKHKSD